MINMDRWRYIISAIFVCTLLKRASGQTAQAAVLQCYSCMYTNAITETGVQCMNPAGIATSQLDPTIVQVMSCPLGNCFMYDIIDQIGLHTTVRGCLQAQTQFQCGQQGVTCCNQADLCNNLDTTPLINLNLICYVCQYTNAGGYDQNIGCLAPNSNSNSAASANISSVACPGKCFTSVTVANDLVTQTVTRGCTTYQPQYPCSSNTCCSAQSFCNGNSMAYIPAGDAARPVASLLVIVASVLALIAA